MAFQKSEKSKDNIQKDENKEPKAKKGISKKLADEGYHNCTLVELEKGQDQNIARFGKEVRKIKAMHESNIDAYNTQQINSLRFIRKDNVKYELDSIHAKGRVDGKGAPKPYTYFVEVKTKKN